MEEECILGENVFICDRCKNQNCRIEVKASDERMKKFDPKYCPYSSGYARWTEKDDGDREEEQEGRLVPRNVQHKIRNTGKMWVVETVMHYGKGFTSRKDVKYFYSKKRAKREHRRRERGR